MGKIAKRERDVSMMSSVVRDDVIRLCAGPNLCTIFAKLRVLTSHLQVSELRRIASSGGAAERRAKSLEFRLHQVALKYSDQLTKNKVNFHYLWFPQFYLP